MDYTSVTVKWHLSLSDDFGRVHDCERQTHRQLQLSCPNRRHYHFQRCRQIKIIIAGSAAELAALRKIDKYSALEKTHFFQPVAVESLGPMNIAAYSFLAELGRQISDVSGDDRESSYLFQRISVLIQRYNATRYLVTRELY